jgi:hypothetical protein
MRHAAMYRVHGSGVGASIRSSYYSDFRRRRVNHFANSS